MLSEDFIESRSTIMMEVLSEQGALPPERLLSLLMGIECFQAQKSEWDNFRSPSGLAWENIYGKK